jgi:hypothetical protein
MTPRLVHSACDCKVKQRSHKTIIGWVTKVYYLEFLRASEGTLSRLSQLLAPTPFPSNVDVRRSAIVTETL